LNDLSDAVVQLSLELRHLTDRERLEGEKLVLEIENALLRLQQRLPPPKS